MSVIWVCCFIGVYTVLWMMRLLILQLSLSDVAGAESL